MKKILAGAVIGAVLLTASPIIVNDFNFNTSTAEAAKGGAKLAIPKPAAQKPNLNKTPADSSNSTKSSANESKPAANESKSVSGSGKEYAPSKNAKDLQSTAPAAKSANTSTAAKTKSSTGFGNMMRNIGLFAGGMMLGGLIGSLFGGFGGFLGDVLGLLFNVIMFYAAYRGIKYLYNKFRGNNDQSKNPYQSQYQMKTKTQDLNQPIDITPPQAINYPNKSTIGMDYDPKRTADYYRNL